MQKKLSTLSICYENGIITSKLYGIFNERSAEENREHLFKLVMSLNMRPFALLSDISEVEGATPEASQWLSSEYKQKLSAHPN